MTDADIEKLKDENARLMQDKARAEAIWHEEVRTKLTKLDTELQAIKLNTTELPQLRRNMETLQDRVRVIEDSKIRATFIGILGFFIAHAITFAFWKFVDHYLFKVP